MYNFLNPEPISKNDLDYLVSVINLLLLNYKSLDYSRKLVTINMVFRLGLAQSIDNIVIPKHDDLIKQNNFNKNVKRVIKQKDT